MSKEPEASLKTLADPNSIGKETQEAKNNARPPTKINTATPRKVVEEFDPSIFDKPESVPSQSKQLKISKSENGSLQSAAPSAADSKGFDFSIFEKPDEPLTPSGDARKSSSHSGIQTLRQSAMKDSKKSTSQSNASCTSDSLHNIPENEKLEEHRSSIMGSKTPSIYSISSHYPRDESKSSPTSSLFRFKGIKREKQSQVRKSTTKELKEEESLDRSSAEPSLSAGIFQKQFYFQISFPGNEAKEGPWSDLLTASPIPHRKLDINSKDSKLHIMTVGKPFGDDTRRIKIYEHEVEINVWDLPIIQKEMKDAPEKALMAAENALTSPNCEVKIVDKILSQANAVKALAGAQLTLSPLYGGWLNPSVVSDDPNSPIVPATDIIYVVEHCLQHGTVVRPLAPFPKNYTREKIKAELGNLVTAAIETCFDHHPDSGFSICIAVPVGQADTNYYC